LQGVHAARAQHAVAAIAKRVAGKTLVEPHAHGGVGVEEWKLIHSASYLTASQNSLLISSTIVFDLASGNSVYARFTECG